MKDIHFGETYIKIHYPTMTEEVNQKDISFVLDLLELQAGASILDVPCGFGRHSLLLAQKGFRVTGVDFSSEFISLALENSKGMDNASFILGDMRKIEFENEFDAVLNLFTSFGYFSDEENLDFLIRAGRALKKKGKFLIDVVNKDWMIQHISENRTMNFTFPDNKVFMARNTYDEHTKRWFSRQVLVENGEKHKQFQDTRLYSLEEMTAMLTEAGLKLISVFGNNAVYGNDHKEPYSTSHRNMIILAEKL